MKGPNSLFLKVLWKIVLLTYLLVTLLSLKRVLTNSPGLQEIPPKTILQILHQGTAPALRSSKTLRMFPHMLQSSWMACLTRLIEDGETGLVTRQVAKKKKQG